MQCLIVLSNRRLAQAFVDYMASRDIDIVLDTEASAVRLYLKDEAYLIEAQSALKQFLANPTDKKYQAASWDMAETRTAQFSYQKADIIKHFMDRAGPVTLSLLFCSTLLLLFSFIGFLPQIFYWTHFPATSGEIWQLWRLFTHTLVHFSLLHFVFNALWWWFFAGLIEKKLGSSKLVQLFLFSALFSGLAQYYFSGANFGGLSGVIYALLGYVAILGRFLPQKGVLVPDSYVIFMVGWLVLGFFQPMGMSIANVAHIAGLVTGCGIACVEVMIDKV